MTKSVDDEEMYKKKNISLKLTTARHYENYQDLEINQTQEVVGRMLLEERYTAEAAADPLVDITQLIGTIVDEAIEKKMEAIEKKFEKRFKEIDLKFYVASLSQQELLVSPPEFLSTKTEENISIDFNFPISDPDQVVELELKLSRNTDFKNILAKELCKFGGTGKNEQADKIIYPVFDYLFDPELLTKFSWTGISRSQEIVKRSFCKLENIIDLVFDVLLLADSRHTKRKNESLIRDKVLKHTNQRLTRKRYVSGNT